MEGAPELAARIAAAKESVERLSGPIESSKGQADALYALMEQRGLEARAQQTKAVADQIEQSQATREGIDGFLSKAHWLMLSVAHGNMGPGAGGVTKSTGSTEPSNDSTSPPEFEFSKHFVPDPDLTKMIDKLGVPPESPNLEEDRTRTKTAKLGRNLIRNSEDIHAAGKDLGDTLGKISQSGYNPLRGAVAETAADTNPTPPVAVSRPEAGVTDVGSAIGTGLVMAAVAVDAIGRFMEVRQRKE